MLLRIGVRFRFLYSAEVKGVMLVFLLSVGALAL